MALPFVLLGLAICATWLPGVVVLGRSFPPWRVPFAFAVVSAMFMQIVDWRGLIALIAVASLGAASNVVAGRAAAGALMLATIGLAFAMAVHRLSGFVELPLADGLRLGDHSPPMSPRASFDTASAGLLLLACYCRRARDVDQWRRGIAVGLSVGAVTSAVVVGGVWVAGFIRWDPKLPAFAAVWLPVNLLFTCVAEEALFRGVLQERLTRLLPQGRTSACIALGLASVLFGVAHGRGGVALVMGATLAGLGYGIAYLLTRRIEAPILAHFFLNATHFLGFTYPYYVS